MSEQKEKQLRTIDAPFVALGPSAMAIRDRLKHLTTEDEKALRLAGEHLSSLASADLKARCADGLDHKDRRRPLERLARSGTDAVRRHRGALVR